MSSGVVDIFAPKQLFIPTKSGVASSPQGDIYLSGGYLTFKDGNSQFQKLVTTTEVSGSVVVIPTNLAPTNMLGRLTISGSKLHVFGAAGWEKVTSG